MKAFLSLCALVGALQLRAATLVADFEAPEKDGLDGSLALGKEPFVDDAERAIYAALSATNKKVKLRVTPDFATSGRKALECSFGRSFRIGFTVSVPETDMSGYDRLCIDVVNSGETEDQLDLQLAFDGEKLNDSVYRVKGKRQTFRAPPGKSVWTMELNRWPKGTDRKRITKLHFFALHPYGATLHLDRIRLLKKGEEDVAGAYSAADEAKIAAIVRTVAERREKERAEAVAGFRARCETVGVRQPDGVLVGWATSMEHVMPKASRALDSVLPPETVVMRLARGEHENVQVVVCPEKGPLDDVSVRCEGMPAGIVTCSALGYVKTKFQSPYAVGRTVADGPEPEAYHRTASFMRPDWYPDPILSHVKSVRVEKNVAQGFWVRVSCPRDQNPGVLTGELVVSAGGREICRIPLRVRVNGFVLPKVAAMPVAMSFNPKGGTGWMPTDAEFAARKASAESDPKAPCRLWRKRRFEWADFLADYLIPFDFLYRVNRDPKTRFPDYEILDRLNKQGRLGPVNLAYWGMLRDGEKALKNYETKTLPYYRSIYERFKELGIADKCFFYGNDEVRSDVFPAVRRSAEALRRDFPGVPLMTTAKDPDFGVGTNSLEEVDWFCPLTGRYGFERAERARAKGKKVWWYVCDGPTWCHANVHIENKPIDTRMLLGALSAHFKADGFLYWQMAKWYDTKPVGDNPFTDWVAGTCFGFNGEGCLVSIGPDGIPLPTVRLENFRDGLEDMAYVKILQEKLAKRGKDDALAERAKALTGVPKSLVKALGEFSDDPKTLYAWRDEMADLIEAIDAGR